MDIAEAPMTRARECVDEEGEFRFNVESERRPDLNEKLWQFCRGRIVPSATFFMPTAK